MPVLSFVEPLPQQVPSRLPIYETEKPKASQRAVRELVGRLGLPAMRTPPEFRLVDHWTIARHGSYTVAVNRLSGAVRLRDEERYGLEIEGRFPVSEEQAVHVSREWLDRVGLLPVPASTLEVGQVTHLRTQGTNVTGEVAPEQILDAGVVFTRSLDGVQVRGFGGYAMVNVGLGSSVVAANKVWRQDVKKVGMVAVLQPDYAIAELQRRLGAAGLEEQVRVKVLKADFCYFEAGDDRRQRYLEPTYAFVYAARPGQGRFVSKSVEVIPATSRPRESWVFRKRFRAPSRAARTA